MIVDFNLWQFLIKTKGDSSLKSSGGLKLVLFYFWVPNSRKKENLEEESVKKRFILFISILFYVDLVCFGPFGTAISELRVRSSDKKTSSREKMAQIGKERFFTRENSFLLLFFFFFFKALAWTVRPSHGSYSHAIWLQFTHSTNFFV